jgi:tripartite-type tricarboxylate transporter receptor subunit TctC
LLVGLAAGMAAPDSSAAAWPTKDITFIVPRTPGGGFDTQSRIFCSVWEKHLPQKVNVLVANRPGAGGKIGLNAVMKAVPDGYTVGMVSPPEVAIMQYEGELEGFDIRKLNWLAQLSWDPGAVVVSAASGVKSPQDLTKREMRIAVMADGLFHNAFFVKKLNLKARRVMFEGTGEEVLALMRGDIDLMMESWPSMKKAVDNSQGKLAPLFILADSRVPLWPAVPCSKELNLNLSEIYPTAGALRVMAAPPGIPADLVKTMEKTVWDTIQDPEFKAKMEKAGYPFFVARGTDVAAAVTMIMKTFTDNKELFELMKK